jgi:serine/threonine-protein kinase
MRSASGAEHEPGEARRVFAEWIARRESGEALDMDALIAASGRLQPELARLWERYGRLQGALRSLGSEHDDFESLSAEARAEFLQLASPDGCGFDGHGAHEHRYQRVGSLGRGGMGLVLRVKDTVLQREVALKRLARAERGAFLRFVDEARLLASLNHPGIVNVLDAGLDAQGRPWFTMPLVRGSTLAQALQERKEGSPTWTLEHLLTVLLQALEAVAYAHARGILHRDLKPANIMIREHGGVQVLDWGLARLLEPDEEGPNAPAHTTRTGGRVGTPAYMSPEQARGDNARLGPGTDVYSAGAILHEILSGKRPYGELGSNGDAVLTAVVAGAPIPLSIAAPMAPAELVAIADRAMQRDPSARYADMTGMARDLRAHLEGRVVQAHGGGPLLELRKWVARNRALSVALLALLASLTLGSAYYAWAQRTQRREWERLADAQILQDLLDAEPGFHPPLPDRLPAIDAWVQRAESLLARLPQHERDLAALKAEGTSDETRWRSNALAALTAQLSALGTEPRGALPRIRALRARGEWLREESLVRAAPLWATLRKELASRQTPGLPEHIPPQFGLIPLGTDRVSGCPEFVHLASGQVPERNSDGELVLGPQHGVVFVLVPGGECVLGSPGDFGWPPANAGKDAVRDTVRDTAARDHEFPQRQVTLTPFLIAKHELTQAQWERLSGANPSYLPLERGLSQERGAHPVDTVSWEDAALVCLRQGWSLPTEAQWEHAARARTATLWWCGNDPSCLAEQRVHGADGQPSGTVSALSGRANPFGLLHVLGNVAEWTLDPYVPDHAGPLRPGTAEHVADPEAGAALLRVARGGSFLSTPALLRSSARDELPLGTRSLSVGIRPLRPID